MGRIEADIALENWLFGFRPCSGQGQLTLLVFLMTLKNIKCQKIRNSLNETIKFHKPLINPRKYYLDK